MMNCYKDVISEDEQQNRTFQIYTMPYKICTSLCCGYCYIVILLVLIGCMQSMYHDVDDVLSDKNTQPDYV